MSEVLLLTHAAATLVMVGVIWFVQIVHYPLMARVSASEFAAYEREHQNRTTLVVAPTMLVEAATATLLLVVPLLGARDRRILATVWWGCRSLLLDRCEHPASPGPYRRGSSRRIRSFGRGSTRTFVLEATPKGS